MNPDASDLTRSSWENHYRREKSRQRYPDENLVRLLSGILRGGALDFGCGSGRHLILLRELGFSPVHGCDYTENALKLSRNAEPEANLFLTPAPGSTPLPLEDEILEVVVLWGVLHYNNEDAIDWILRESRRVLRTGGFLVGSLRSSRDTHFRTNADMKDASIRLFSRQEAGALLAPYFSEVDFGYSERTPVGEEDRVVSHWIFRARKTPDGASL